MLFPRWLLNINWSTEGATLGKSSTYFGRWWNRRIDMNVLNWVIHYKIARTDEAKGNFDKIGHFNSSRIISIVISIGIDWMGKSLIGFSENGRGIVGIDFAQRCEPIELTATTSLRIIHFVHWIMLSSHFKIELIENWETETSRQSCDFQLHFGTRSTWPSLIHSYKCHN